MAVGIDGDLRYGLHPGQNDDLEQGGDSLDLTIKGPVIGFGFSF